MNTSFENAKNVNKQNNSHEKTKQPSTVDQIQSYREKINIEEISLKAIRLGTLIGLSMYFSSRIYSR